jgi:hypothetical protein
MKVMIIRHAEKPAKNDPAVGVGPNGSQDEKDLTVKGWQRAGALVRFFAPIDDHYLDNAISRPTTIFASGIGPNNKSKRPRHTVLPLSKLIGVEITDSFLKGEERDLARAILNEQGVVLVAWEHKAISDIVSALTSNEVSSPAWPDDRFDIVLVLQSAASGWKLTQVPQMLLGGDRRDLLTNDLAP